MEVLIVVALIALLSGAIVFGSGMFTGSRVRGAATLIISATRMAQTRANATGRATRVVFDLENHRVRLEEANTGAMLREKEGAESAGAGAEASTELEKAAREEAERLVDGPRAPRPAFVPISETVLGEDALAGGRELGKGVKFREVQTEHDGEPRREGQAYLYAWPGGETERAVVQLFDGRSSDEGLTVTVSALTGRARVERGRVELPQPRLGEAYSEREEE